MVKAMLIPILILSLCALSRAEEEKKTVLKNISNIYYADMKVGTKDEMSRMAISLYSSVSFLADNCLGFFHYDSNNQNTNPDNTISVKSLEYPYFKLDGSKMLPTLGLMDNFWTTGQHEQAFAYANNCTGNWSDYGAGVHGVAGLGIDTGASHNYPNKSEASTQFSLNWVNNTFVLQANPPVPSPENYMHRFTLNATGNNWNLDNITYLQVGNAATNISLNSTKLIFDINSESIAVPLFLYNTILEGFGKYGYNCSNSTLSLPKCVQINQDQQNRIQDLPIIKIYRLTEYGKLINQSESLKLQPEMYVYDADSKKKDPIPTFQLNIRAVNSNLAGPNYVTPEFNTTIIIGASVLKKFYTVFTVGQQMMSFYIEVPPKKSTLKFWIIGGVVCLVMLLAIFAIHKLQKARQAREAMYAPLEYVDKSSTLK